MEDFQQTNVAPTLTYDAFIAREMILNTLYASGGGHYGGALSVVDILLVLYKKILNITSLDHRIRDNLILSKGHAAVALYCILAELNFFDKSTLVNYGKFRGGLEGHPDMTVTPGIDFSSGSLGQGLSVGLGMALAKKNKAHVWIVLGDGECQEGQIWEAALLASRYAINNLHVVVDANGAQECGYKYDMSLPQEPVPLLVEKWKAFGWEVLVVDGHDLDALEKSFLSVTQIKQRPSVIIAHTRKGAWVPMFEKDPEYYHCVSLTENEHTAAIKELKSYATARQGMRELSNTSS